MCAVSSCLNWAVGCFAILSRCAYQLNAKGLLPGASILPEIHKEAEKAVFLLFGQVCQIQAAALQQNNSSVMDI